MIVCDLRSEWNSNPEASIMISFIVINLANILAVFYFILFPISLLSKLFTKDPLMLSIKYDSYFIDINKIYDKENAGKTR